MFKVKAQAKPRTYNGHQFNDYWCAGLHWPGLESQERDLTENQLKEMQQEEKDGHPIRVISFEEIVELEDPSFIPATAEVIHEETTTEPPQPVVSLALDPLTPVDSVKKPWET